MDQNLVFKYEKAYKVLDWLDGETYRRSLYESRKIVSKMKDEVYYVIRNILLEKSIAGKLNSQKRALADAQKGLKNVQAQYDIYSSLLNFERELTYISSKQNVIYEKGSGQCTFDERVLAVAKDMRALENCPAKNDMAELGQSIVKHCNNTLAKEGIKKCADLPVVECQNNEGELIGQAHEKIAQYLTPEEEREEEDIYDDLSTFIDKLGPTLNDDKIDFQAINKAQQNLEDIRLRTERAMKAQNENGEDELLKIKDKVDKTNELKKVAENVYFEDLANRFEHFVVNEVPNAQLQNDDKQNIQNFSAVFYTTLSHQASLNAREGNPISPELKTKCQNLANNIDIIVNVQSGDQISQ